MTMWRITQELEISDEFDEIEMGKEVVLGMLRISNTLDVKGEAYNPVSIEKIERT